MFRSWPALLLAVALGCSPAAQPRPEAPAVAAGSEGSATGDSPRTSAAAAPPSSAVAPSATGSTVAVGAEAPPPGTLDGVRPATAPAEPGEGPNGELEQADAENEIEDDVEVPAPTRGGAWQPVPEAVAKLSDQELARRLRAEPETLGSMSVGQANGGSLVNAVALPPSPLWEVVDPSHAWATEETVEYLRRAAQAVRTKYPNAGPLYVGHLSGKHGGHLPPHRSHQSGRDVDTGFFYSTPPHTWYRRATAENLDRPKTWAFVRALLTETDVEYIFLNGPQQKLLYDYALGIGEDRGWLDEVFQVGAKNAAAIIRYAKGHDNHLHVRFYNPAAQELGRRAYPQLVALGRLKAPQSFVRHRAVKGDTLGYLARHYGTTVQAIQRANGLRGIALQAKRVYLIPKEGSVAVRAPSAPVRVPARRLPPPPPSSTASGSGPDRARPAPGSPASG